MTQNDGSPDTTALYAWISRDQDGIEGIITAPVTIEGIESVVSLVFSSRAVAGKAAHLARYAAELRGFPAKLVRFERAEEIDSV